MHAHPTAQKPVKSAEIHKKAHTRVLPAHFTKMARNWKHSKCPPAEWTDRGALLQGETEERTRAHSRHTTGLSLTDAAEWEEPDAEPKEWLHSQQGHAQAQLVWDDRSQNLSHLAVGYRACKEIPGMPCTPIWLMVTLKIAYVNNHWDVRLRLMHFYHRLATGLEKVSFHSNPKER